VARRRPIYPIVFGRVGTGSPKMAKSTRVESNELNAQLSAAQADAAAAEDEIDNIPDLVYHIGMDMNFMHARMKKNFHSATLSLVRQVRSRKENRHFGLYNGRRNRGHIIIIHPKIADGHLFCVIRRLAIFGTPRKLWIKVPRPLGELLIKKGVRNQKVR